MKNVFSLVFLLFIMASLAQGAMHPGGNSDEEAWNHFGSAVNLDGDGADLPGRKSPPVLGDAPDSLPALVPVPALVPGVPDEASPQDVLTAVVEAASLLWADATTSRWSWWGDPTSDADPVAVAPVREAAPAHAGAAELPPVVLEHLDEYFHRAPVDPVDGSIGSVTDLDACATEGLRLATLWANSERGGIPLSQGYAGIQDDLPLTEPFLSSLGLSRILVGWTVSNVTMDIAPESIWSHLTDWDRGRLLGIFGFALKAPNEAFSLSCISGPSPRDVRELILDIMPLVNPDRILEEGRNRVATVYGAQRASHHVLEDMRLGGEEAFIGHQAKIKRRIKWIRDFLDKSRPDAVAGDLGVGSLLVAICRQREGTDQQVPYVYGFNAWGGINMKDVTYRNLDAARIYDLPEGRVGAYRMLGRPVNLLQSQSHFAGTRILLPRPETAAQEPQPAQAILAQAPVQTSFLSVFFQNVDVSAFLPRAWVDLFEGWSNWGFAWVSNFWGPAVQPETAEDLSQRILGDVDIIPMGEDVLRHFRNQMAARIAAADAAAWADGWYI